jgi:hypothetical protein
MRDQEIIGLWEAYSSIYASQEEVETLNEAITSAKGKAKAAEMIAARSTPSGRAKSGKGANVAQIRKIGLSNREGLGGTPMTPTMAKNPVKKQNYDGSGNRAARRAGKEVKDPPEGIRDSYEYDLYDIILSHLLDEGYAETPEAAEKIMVNMSEEWREDIMEGMSMKDFKANRKKLQRKEASADARKRGHEGKTWADSGKTYSPDQAKRNRANMTDATRQALYRVANNPDDDGGDDHYPASKTKNPKKLRKQKAMGEIGESYDLYDIILSHLLDEGYADTQQAAEAIMVNMGEEWRESIIEADSIEAMRARAAKRRKQRYGASDTSRGGRDDFRPYTEDDYKRPGPGSQAKES